ncbi:metal-dependent hydrolase [Lacihabitans sp. LS3-19]|uniref:DinB family protein n=1 Tax=Lacihabitans sp. LS3-19 TaxID=2487335 RepID=UPI0020CD7607|nr:DinB family protein [Lacihabitans sp. LS3-19]MCP9768721.1 metal-dependent hydrolase [Lacihabitans sp. LS3-19]
MEILKLLSNSKLEAAKYFDLPDDKLKKSYGEGKWSIKEILVHLADAESVLLDRIKRVISEPKQVIWAFDQNLWSAHLDYKNYPLHLSKTVFLANRENIFYLASKYYDSLGTKEFIHSETGLRTLKDEFGKVEWHCQGHLEQIKIALIL